MARPPLTIGSSSTETRGGRSDAPRKNHLPKFCAKVAGVSFSRPRNEGQRFTGSSRRDSENSSACARNRHSPRRPLETCGRSGRGSCSSRGRVVPHDDGTVFGRFSRSKAEVSTFALLDPDRLGEVVGTHGVADGVRDCPDAAQRPITIAGVHSPTDAWTRTPLYRSRHGHYDHCNCRVSREPYRGAQRQSGLLAPHPRVEPPQVRSVERLADAHCDHPGLDRLEPAESC
jgi:hypothetical protein